MAFCRVMRGYHTGYRETLELPIRTFWFMNMCINRLEAESNLRDLDTGLASQVGGEHFDQFRNSLVLEMGSIVVAEEVAPKLDRAGLASLKNMM